MQPEGEPLGEALCRTLSSTEGALLLPLPLCICNSLQSLSCVTSSPKCLLHACSVMSDSAILWTVAHQAPLFMGFSRQEYWNGLPFPSPGDRPNLGIEPTSPASSALASRFFTTEPSRKLQIPLCLSLFNLSPSSTVGLKCHF